jgi:transposase
VPIESVDIWFQDEARIGQQGTITRVWAPKGTRYRLKKQQQFLNAYIFGAVCPEKDMGAAVVMPYANTAAMKIHLEEISKNIPEGRHAAVILDQARWHTAKHLNIPENITLVPLPPYSPELNAQEPVWLVLRQDYLANMCFDSVEHIINSACEAWNNFVHSPQKIKSLCTREWAVVNVIN